MKLLLICLLALTLLPSLACAEDEAFTAVWGTPAVDAEIDECWADAPVYALRGGNASASVRVMWDDRALYVLAEVTDPQLDVSAARDLSVMKTNLFMEESNASALLRELMAK